jgi:hypothetical protein
MNELYVFVDESGNFDFSPTGSLYFVMSAVVTSDPIQGVDLLLKWRHHVLAGADGHPQAVSKPRDCTHFHCSEDEQYTRNGVFSIIEKLDVSVYSVIVQKNKAKPSIRTQDIFYQRTFKALVPYILRRNEQSDPVHVFVSQIGLKSKRSAMVASLKEALNAGKGGFRHYYLHFHPNHSHHMLQVSDYVCWAIARKWERNDDRSHATVAGKIATEFDLFSRGTRTYY